VVHDVRAVFGVFGRPGIMRNTCCFCSPHRASEPTIVEEASPASSWRSCHGVWACGRSFRSGRAHWLHRTEAQVSRGRGRLATDGGSPRYMAEVLMGRALGVVSAWMKA